MVEKTQVNIRVTEAQKAKWQEYAEEHHGSLTKLISTAVSKEIDGPSDDAEGGPSSEAVTDLHETVNSLENTVRDMDTRLSSVQESVQSTGPDFSFRAAVRETVPTDEHLTVGEIAARLDARKTDVQEALDAMDGEAVATPDREKWTKLEGA